MVQLALPLSCLFILKWLCDFVSYSDVCVDVWGEKNDAEGEFYVKTELFQTYAHEYYFMSKKHQLLLWPFG